MYANTSKFTCPVLQRMASAIRVAHTLTWDPPEMAGGTYLLDNGSTIHVHGIGVPLFEDIVDALNLTAEYQYVEFLASIISVANGSADVGSLTLAHTEYYTHLGIGTTMAYLHPVSRESSMVFFRQPPFHHIQTTIFRPFKTTAWLIMLALNFIVATIITNARGNHFSSRFAINIIVNALHLTVARISVHPVATKYYSDTSPIFNRRVILVKAFFSVFFMALYTAKFVSVFTQTEQLIKLPEDLVKHNFAFSSYSSMHIQRLFSTPELLKIVNASVQSVNGLETIEKVIGKDAKNPKQALLSFPDGFFPQALFGLKYGREICLVSSFQSTVKTPRCPYIKKDSPFREQINLKILHMIERGLIYRLQRNHQQKYMYTCPNSKTVVQPIHTNHVAFGYLILIIGYSFAILWNFTVDKNVIRKTKFGRKNMDFL